MMLERMNLLALAPRATLTTRFAVYSFICIGAMTVALWVIVSDYLVGTLLQREWEATAQLVRADVRDYLTAEDFTTKDRKSVGHKFQSLLEHMVLLPDIFRFKVYNNRGVVIWSDDKQLVGKSFADNKDLAQALRGKTVADISSLDKSENIFEIGTTGAAVEVYVPIYAENSRELLGVFETYKRADTILREVRGARMVVLTGAFGGGLLLYFSLFAIVRQAARKIDEQQENLSKMQSELIASQRLAAVGEVAAAVAHGIGNPLSSIRAAAQVALLDCRTNNGTEQPMRVQVSLQDIIQQVDRVQKRMQGLLNFAKPLAPRPGPVEVNAVLSDVVTTLRPRFAAAQVEPKLELDPLIPKSQMDANHLEQILMALITNALEATPCGGTVLVRTKLLNGAKRALGISIEDCGEGIAREIKERVFEPFFTTKSQGTGIGLPLAKKFVERNGGTIAISTASGRGTVVDLEFPWREPGECT